ncbi:MAG: hypothetical protein ACYS6K_11975 [Planctomycetota bacterium]|jgi:hypothetical protein
MKKSIIICVIALTLIATSQAPASYTETWDNGSLEGWTVNTIISNVEVVNTGGNPGGYLRSWGTGLIADTYDIGAKTLKTVFTGDFSAKGVTGVSVDLNFMNGTFDGAWVRFRYMDASQNGWLYPVTDTYQNNWQTFSFNLNPNWTDAEARAAGWLSDDEVIGGVPSPPFQTTMSNVYTAEVRISGIGDVEAGIDNFSIITTPATLSGWVYMIPDAPDFGYSLDEADFVYFYSFDFVQSFNTVTGGWSVHMPVGWVYFDWPFYFELVPGTPGILWLAWPPAGGIGVYHNSTGEWEILPQIIP